MRNDDPPDYPEPPECCGEIMETDGHDCVCLACGKRPEPEPDIEPVDDWVCPKCGVKYPCRCEDEPEGPEHCPHGKVWGECPACDHLGDIAFDQAREQ